MLFNQNWNSYNWIKNYNFTTEEFLFKPDLYLSNTLLMRLLFHFSHLQQTFATNFLFIIVLYFIKLLTLNVDLGDLFNTSHSAHVSTGVASVSSLLVNNNLLVFRLCCADEHFLTVDNFVQVYLKVTCVLKLHI